MAKGAGVLKKVKNVIGKFTAKTIKAVGYGAKTIGKVAQFGEKFYDVGKIGGKGVTGLLIPGISKFVPGASIVGNWYKDEMNANRNYIGNSGKVWDKVGDVIIGIGNKFEPY